MNYKKTYKKIKRLKKKIKKLRKSIHDDFWGTKSEPIRSIRDNY